MYPTPGVRGQVLTPHPPAPACTTLPSVRTDRPSLTAELVAAVRALYTEMPEPLRLAEDPLAHRMVPALLALPARALALAPWAGPALHRALGTLSLSLTYHVALRTRAIDDALRAAIDAGATQLVILG